MAHQRRVVQLQVGEELLGLDAERAGALREDHHRGPAQRTRHEVRGVLARGRREAPPGRQRRPLRVDEARLERVSHSC